MKTLLSVTLAVIFSAAVLAQSTGSANATITANLKKGLSIAKVGGSLDYGEIILNGSAQNPTITPGSGTNFKVIGHPNKPVTVTFANATLTNNAWVTTNGGTNGTITFTPNVQNTGSASTYTSPTAVTSGSAIPLVNVSGDGNLYLWVGGTLAIGATQAHGDYTGTITMSVAY